MIKKRDFLITLLIIFILGVLTTIIASNLISMIFGMVTVNGSQYEEYKLYKEKYRKLIAFEEYIKSNYYLPIDEGVLEIGAYKGQFASLGDIYTTYYTASEFAAQNERTQGEFTGIGAYLFKDDEGEIVIERVIEGGSAETQGLLAGDVIVNIDGRSYKEEELKAAVDYLRGEEGTTVNLLIRRDENEFDVVLTRTVIATPSVYSYLRDDGIGYIQVASFSGHSAEEFKNKLADMENDQAKGLIIDLRNNLGGIVEQGVEIADMLLDAGTVATLIYGDGEEVVYETKAGATDIPYTVLVNAFSASTSEILAAAIKENHGGFLVGTVTTGKGIVQKLEAFRDGDGARITIAQYYTPEGHQVNGVGVTPDYIVEESDVGDVDVQLEKAVELLLTG